MRWRRLIDLSDPTFVALVASLCLICQTPRPWAYSCVRPDFRLAWLYLWVAQSIAVAVLFPRTRLAWVSLGIAAVLLLPPNGWPGESGFTGTLLVRVLRMLPGGPSYSLVSHLLWATVIGGTALCVRSALGQVHWTRPVAAAVLAVVASLGARVAPELLPLEWVIHLAPHDVAKIVAILVYLSPALVFPVILWRAARWPEPLLLAMLTAAMPALSWAICDFEWPPGPVALTLALIVAASGGAVAWWRLRDIPETGHGFDVIPRTAG